MSVDFSIASGELFALSAVEDRQLTEQFAGIDQRQNRLFAFRSDVVQLDSPGGEQKDRFAGFGGHVDETASRNCFACETASSRETCSGERRSNRSQFFRYQNFSSMPATPGQSGSRK